MQENIELNENKILKEIVDIVRSIAIENNIDIILFEEQYFLASDAVDISEQIYNKINNINIILQLSKYE